MNRARVIYNPQADGGRVAKRAGDLQARLQSVARKNQWSLEWVETRAPGHASGLAEAAALDGCDLVIATGGDGTINEIINGLMSVEKRGATPTLGIIPVGSGNDFAWSAQVALDPDIACQRVLDGETRMIDLGHIQEANGRQRFFCNGCGVGFDGRVALEVERLKWLRGFTIYLIAVLKTLILYHEVPELRIRLDEREWVQPSMMLIGGNGRRLGGGFLVTPEARLDDGLLDVCIAGELSRVGILKILPRFVRGTHVTHQQVKMERARQVSVESTLPRVIHLDGEIFATDASRFKIRVVPGALCLRI
jgi:YegS/Rv2252/BmrU family lipid kinase